ncbi:1,4-beta-N-acetylmuramidase [Lacticaseibacillus chiayiensis]|uniref:1,4-beta-N-acetylmuramidase n=1 Tax=Lacticaseibacillus chiayiensis TaxID=2100821 RepID=A0A4V1P2L1_9LACO|nr:GH25 family lysozyme [Lacticaseibacillus chiayiensis]RXT27900.1 1,4-beta-N-acetylmuramidase [Lacticaseibacillus chiayiensis]
MRSRRVIYADTYRHRWHRWLFIAGCILVSLLLLGWWLQRNPRPDPATYPILGVRLDQTDGVQDFYRLRSSKVSFVYLKATEGSSYFDDNFNTNFDQAAGSRLSIGVYHVFSFETTPQAQALQFERKVGSNIGDLPIGIFLSYYSERKPSAAWLTQHLNAFIMAIQQRYHRSVLLMGSPDILAKVKTVVPQAPRWIVSNKRPAQSGNFWQYTNGARIPNGPQAAYRAAVFLGKRSSFLRLAH